MRRSPAYIETPQIRLPPAVNISHQNIRGVHSEHTQNFIYPSLKCKWPIHTKLLAPNDLISLSYRTQYCVWNDNVYYELKKKIDWNILVLPDQCSRTFWASSRYRYRDTITSKILYFLYNCFQFSIHQQAYVPMFMICTYCNEHDACQIWQIWLKIYRGKIYWKRENSIILALGPPNICMPTTLETSVFWVCWNALQHYMCICVELITLPLFIHDVVCISFRQGLASHDQHSRLTGDLCGIFGVFLPLACFITVLNFVHFSSMTITVVFHRTKPSQCWMRFLYLTHTQFVAVVNLMLCGILYCAVSLMRSNGTVWWCYD